MQEPTRKPDGASESNDPFAEFYGKYTADVPDLTLRHDYYIGEAAMETHEEQDEQDNQVSEQNNQ